MADDKIRAVDSSPDEELNHVQFMNNAWKASDDAWRPRRASFDESWALFWNRYDFSKKAPWQSKNFAPKMNRMVRQATYAFKRALVGTSDYFSVEGVGSKSKERQWVVAKIMKYWLDKNNFVSVAVDSLFASMLSSLMVFKVYWETQPCDEVTEATPPATGADKLSAALLETPGQPKGVIPGPLTTERKVYGRLRVDPIDPNRVRLDSTGRRKYVIHEFDMDLHDLRELAKVAANRYEKEVVDSIGEDFLRADEDGREKMRQGQQNVADQNRTFRRTVVVREYWGELFDSGGHLVGRNMTFSVANEKYLIRKPFKNPYLPDELPFVWGAPLRVPFSNFHQSFAENINGLCRIATEIMNLTLDANLWASIKAFELDLDQVVDPNEFKNGVYPGKVFKKRTRGVPRAMVTPLEMGAVNPQNLQFSGAVEREIQNSTGINEFAAGFVGARKTELATEINVKSAQSEGYLNDIAGEVEEGVFDPLLGKCWRTITAHMSEADYTSAELRELLGNDAADMLAYLSEAGRRDYLSGRYDFRFRGMSSMLEKGRDLEKCNLVIDGLNKIPGAITLLKDRGIPLVRKFFNSLNWNPEEFVELGAAPPAGAPSVAPPPSGAPGSPVAPPPGANMLMQALLSRAGGG